MKDSKQFSIYWCNLGPTFGSQIKKTRLCAIVSPDEMNETLRTVIVVPLTSTVRNQPFYLPVTYRKHKGALACDQIKAIDKRRIGDHFANLTTSDSRKLSSILCSMFQLAE